jgi:hypothetical protein
MDLIRRLIQFAMLITAVPTVMAMNGFGFGDV